MRGKQMMALHQGEEARLLKEIDALQNQLVAVRRMMRLLGGDPEVDESQPRQRRKTPSPIEDAVLGLISEFKDTGLAVGEVMELSEKRGRPLDRASVSSLLSRLKREHVLVAVGDGKYRPAPPAPPPSPEQNGGPKLNIVR